MHRSRLALTFVFALLAAAPAAAQSPAFRLAWSQVIPAGGALADVQTGFVYTVKVNGGAAVVLPQTCTAAAAGGASCTAPLPAGLKPGDVLALTAADAGGATAAANTITIPAAPAAPGGFTITITITIGTPAAEPSTTQPAARELVGAPAAAGA